MKTVKKWSNVGANRKTLQTPAAKKSFLKYALELERGRAQVKQVAKTDDYSIYQGDCMALMLSLGDNSIDYIVTDPPYASGGRQQSGARNQITKNRQSDVEWFLGDNMGTETYLWFMSNLAKQYARILSYGGHAYVFTDWRQYTNIVMSHEAAGLTLRNLIVWDKNRGTALGSFWRSNHEFIAVFTKGQPRPLAHRSTYNTFTLTKLPNNLHPTEKPVKLLSYLAGALTPGVILDPFLGSGTTGVGAAAHGHKFIGIDHNGYYAQEAAKRIAAAYQQPRLDI